MLQIGNDEIKDIYVGSDQIKEVYYGSEKVWGEIEPVGDGYWVHKDTGVKTYFGLDDPSMDGEAMNPPSWREDCSEVNIPVGVIYLQPNCFSACESLTSITLPEGVTYLGDYCFSNCSSLTSITLPESVRYLEPSCFYYCTSLTSITLPESVEYLGGMCFAECRSLTSITIPESVTSLEASCFEGCESLTSVTLPDSVSSIGYGCFAFCNSLTSITLPEGVISIGGDCFLECTSLILATVLPATPPTLGFNAFDFVHASFNIEVRMPYVNDYRTATNWVAYANIIFPIGAIVFEDPKVANILHTSGRISNPTFSTKEELAEITSIGTIFEESNITSFDELQYFTGVTSLGSWRFAYCESLTSITLPESVTSLGLYCFYGCTSLTSINIPEGVTSLESNCFANCASLILATVLPAIPPSMVANVFNNVHASFNIKVRSPYVNAYKAATNWNIYAGSISAI